MKAAPNQNETGERWDTVAGMEKYTYDIDCEPPEDHREEDPLMGQGDGSEVKDNSEEQSSNPQNHSNWEMAVCQ